jgi:hypothetical protein
MADHYTLRLAPGIKQRLTGWARRSGMPERGITVAAAGERALRG